jgi:hypothetical protein
MNLHRIKDRISSISRFVQRRADWFAYIIIFTVITISSIAPLSTGGKLNLNNDFFQYASRHEAVRKSLLEHHTFPLRSHWFGGGFPTVGDPEDSTLNPLTVFTVLLGTVMGLKVIVYIALLVGGLASYALGRYVLGYTRWGALFAGLVFGTSLFVPMRIQDGNPNEIYAAFLPLCMLLIGLACRGKKIALLILPFVFYTMLSDGKLTFFMAIFYIGLFCLLDIFPPFSTLAPEHPPRKIEIRPMKILLLALALTFLVGMVRILPSLQFLEARGGLGKVRLIFHPKTYRTEHIFAYQFPQLVLELVGWKVWGRATVGFVPIILLGVVLFVFWKKALPWAISLLLFGWLLLAHNAPIDLLKFLWKLPVFHSIYRPYKYFSFQIVFTFALASGQFFWLLGKLRHRWLEHFCAVILLVASVGVLYPRMIKIQRQTYDFDTPAEFLVQEEDFFNVKGLNLPRGRTKPFRSATYLNVLRNVGTIDWYTGIRGRERAIPKYFVDADNNQIPNPEYQGEAFFLEPGNTARAVLRPNSITVEVKVQKPGVLVINQNYHPAWRADRGELSRHSGLLALRLSDTGSYTVRLRYILTSFYAGLVISILGLAVLAFFAWAYWRGRLLLWSKNASSLVRRLSRAVLWLID